MIHAICTLAGSIGVLLLLAWFGMTTWVTNPIAWDWWKPTADWDAMWRRAHHVLLWRWFAVLAAAAAAFAVAATWTARRRTSEPAERRS